MIAMEVPGQARDGFALNPHSTTPATSSAAWRSTSVPAAAHSGLIFSASLWESPSTQGHITITVGATRLIQQAS